MTETVRCIDISHWQGFPDFKRLRQQGVLAMIHKATEGTSYIDPNRATNCAKAKHAGVAFCCYFWLKPGNARRQAQFFLDTIEPVPGERVVIDYEEDGCTLDDLKLAVQTLLEFGNGAPLRVTIYSGHLLKQQLGSGFDEFLAQHTDLWLAQYTSGEPDWPKATWPKWSLWQYTDQGELDGIEGSTVDCNRFDGSDQQLIDWISPQPMPAPAPAPTPPDRVVEVVITAPPDVQINVTVNEQR